MLSNRLKCMSMALSLKSHHLMDFSSHWWLLNFSFFNGSYLDAQFIQASHSMTSMYTVSVCVQINLIVKSYIYKCDEGKNWREGKIEDAIIWLEQMWRWYENWEMLVWCAVCFVCMDQFTCHKSNRDAASLIMCYNNNIEWMCLCISNKINVTTSKTDDNSILVYCRTALHTNPYPHQCSFNSVNVAYSVFYTYIFIYNLTTVIALQCNRSFTYQSR